jgi:hypothetical protein
MMMGSVSVVHFVVHATPQEHLQSVSRSIGTYFLSHLMHREKPLSHCMHCLLLFMIEMIIRKANVISFGKVEAEHDADVLSLVLGGPVCVCDNGRTDLQEADFLKWKELPDDIWFIARRVLTDILVQVV